MGIGAEARPASIPIEEIDVSLLCYTALLDADLFTLGDITAKTRKELLAVPGIGRGALSQIEHVLRNYSLTFHGEGPPQAVTSLAELLQRLPDRERQLIQLRFGIDCERLHTLREIGREFKVTPERIRQIETRALSRMRWWTIRVGLPIPADTPERLSRKLAPLEEDRHNP